MAEKDKLEVVIEADTRKLTSGLKQASTQLDRTARVAKTTGATVKTAFAGVGAALKTAFLPLLTIGAIVGTINRATQAFQEQEQAVVALNQALKSTGQFSSLATEQIQASASALQNVTTFGDEAILKSTAILQGYANLAADELPKAQQALIAVAKASGTDLNSAAQLLGKTLGSTTNALSRYGVQLDESDDKSTKLSKTLDTLGAFFDQATAEAQTSAGAYDQLSNATGDLFESIGALINEGLQLPSLFQASTSAIQDLTFQVEAFRIGIEQNFGPAFELISNTADALQRLQGLDPTNVLARSRVGQGAAGRGAAASVLEGLRPQDPAAARITRAIPTPTDTDRGARGQSAEAAAREAERAQKTLEAERFRTLEFQKQLQLRNQIAQIEAAGTTTEQAFQEAEQLRGLRELELQQANQLIQAKQQAGLLTEQEAQAQQLANDLALIDLQTEQKIAAEKLKQAQAEQQVAIAQAEVTNLQQQLAEAAGLGAENQAKIRQELQQAQAELEIAKQQFDAIVAASGATIGNIQQWGESTKAFTNELATVETGAQSTATASADSFTGAFKNAASGIGNALSGAFQEGEFSAKKFGEAALNVVLNLVSTLATSALSAGFGGGGGGGLGGLFGGFFANGGRPPLGKVSVVGENGPELFVPDSAGTIIPNSALNPPAAASPPGGMFGLNAGGMQATPSVVNITIKALDGADVERVLSQPEARGVIGNFATQATQKGSNRSFNASPFERQRRSF